MSTAPTSPRRAGAPTTLPRHLPLALRLVFGLGGLVLGGTLLLLLPGVSTHPLHIQEAMFTAVSALTVTGLSVINIPTDLTPFGQSLLAVLIQTGGIGFLSLTVLIFRLLGRRIPLLDRYALRNAIGAVSPAGVMHVFTRVLISVLIIESIGALLLWLRWRAWMDNDAQALGMAIFHSISAFCNAGFDLFTGSPAYPEGLPTDSITLAILSALIIIGGLGAPVIADLLSLWKDRKLMLHTRITLVIILLLLIVGWVGIFAAESLQGSATSAHWPDRLGGALFMSVAARTAGFSTGPGFTGLTPASQFLVTLLMFIGAAPASMGGGITTGTAAALAVAVVSYVRNRPNPEVGGRTIASGNVQRATAVLVISLLVVTMATWLLLVSHPGTTLVTALFEVVSAFATCGLSLAFTGQLNVFGQVVIMFVMFWGRLGALTVVVALARPNPPALVNYPEEQILIG